MDRDSLPVLGLVEMTVGLIVPVEKSSIFSQARLLLYGADGAQRSMRGQSLDPDHDADVGSWKEKEENSSRSVSLWLVTVEWS